MCFAAPLLLAFAGVPVQSQQQVMNAGPAPVAVAVNPANNTIYIANQGNSTLTVVNGASNSTTTVNEPSGSSGPAALGVNPATNKIYVANNGSGNVTVINVATNNTTNVNAGTNPCAVAVNPATNKIYVANCGSANVTIIDGTTDTPTNTVTVGTNPTAIAVNAVTNKIYVANSGSNTVSVIDGANPGSAPKSVNVGTSPTAVAINTVTNKIYVANKGNASSDPGNVTVIDGATDSPTTASDPKAKNPYAVAINPVTNKIYFANNGSANVTVLDGASNNTTSVGVGNNPVAIAVDVTTNQIYVANTNISNAGTNSDVSIIDGASNKTTELAPAGSDQINTLAVAVNPVTHNVYVTFTFGTSGYLWMFQGTIPSTSATVADTNAKGPYALAVNPVTNKIYVANHDSGNVSVIDGTNLSNTLVTVNVGSNPSAIAVNPSTDKIYVVNDDTSGTVSVIDGANLTNAPATVNVGTSPVALAVNAVTNKIYVANSGSNNVSVIDGTTDTVIATVTVGATPVDITVNPATNLIYVANSQSPLYKNNLSVIDGATNNATFINLIYGPTHVGVDPVRNMIYAAPPGINSFVVIDGSTGQIWYVPESLDVLRAMAVDVANGKVYVAANCAAGGGISSLGIITPPANSQSTPGVKCLLGTVGYLAATVNPVTDTAYLLALPSGTTGLVSVIDGVTNDRAGSVNAPFGNNSQAVAVNPVSGALYVANNGSNNVTVWSSVTASIPITVAITPLEGNATSASTPTFTFTVSNSFSSAPADEVYYQVDTWQGSWTAASSQGSGSFSGATPTLQYGFHILYAYASDGEEGTSTISGAQSSPVVGSIAAYGFVVGPPGVASASPGTLSFGTQAIGAASTAQNVTLNNTGSGTLHFGVAFSGTKASDFAELTTDSCGALSGQLAPAASCTIGVTFTPSIAGAESATLTITDDSNGTQNSTQTVALTGSGTGPIVNLSALALTFSGQAVGTKTAAQTETLTNTGNANLTISTVTIAGANAADFSTSADTCTGPTVVPNGTCTVNVIFTPSATGARSASLSFTDNASGSPQSVALSGAVPDFTLTVSSGSSSNASVAPGQTATYTLSTGGIGGFTQSVAFACSGAPSEATCTVSPTQITAGSSPTSITVSVTTTAPSSALVIVPSGPPHTLRGILALAIFVLGLASTRLDRRALAQKSKSTFILLGTGILLTMVIACGGGSGSGGGGGGGGHSNPGTPAGTSSITVTGTSGSGSSAVTHTVTLTLNVT